MRDIQNIIHEYDSKNIIQHEWGQNITSLFNRITKIWNTIAVGEKIAISSYKKFGIKSAVRFFEKNGLHPKVVGKGSGNLRFVEILKDVDIPLHQIESHETVDFIFRGKNYTVTVGSAIFSKIGLDYGTRFLLETVFDTRVDFNNCRVADLGSGWGAISLILLTEFSSVQIIAFEKDESSIEASQKNLKPFTNAEIIGVDLGKNFIKLERYRKSFDYIISNPPFHVKKGERTSIFEHASNMLKPNGEMFFVTEGHFVDRFRKTASEYFKIMEEKSRDLWVVFRCKAL